MLLLLLIGAGTGSAPATPLGPPAEFAPIARATDFQPHIGVEFVPI